MNTLRLDDLIRTDANKIPNGYRFHSVDEVSAECGDTGKCFAVREGSLADTDKLSVVGFYEAVRTMRSAAKSFPGLMVAR